MAAKKSAKVKRSAAKKAAGRRRPPVRAAAPKRKAKPVAKARRAAPTRKPAPVKAVARLPAPKVAPKAAAKPTLKPIPAKAAAAVKVSAVAPKPVVPLKAPPARPLPAPAIPLRRPGIGPRGLSVLRPVMPGRGFAPGGDGEDDEGALSLLAGPRNVKPYLAKKGEQYMGKAQLVHFQAILLSWKRDLMEEVDRTVTHMKDEAANPPDPNDRATLESEFSLELRTRDRERKLIRKIDEALKRIEDGSYGYCLETGEEIGIKRLEARPVATLSIEAQERRERREKQYGDRDDRYR